MQASLMTTSSAFADAGPDCSVSILVVLPILDPSQAEGQETPACKAGQSSVSPVASA